MSTGLSDSLEISISLKYKFSAVKYQHLILSIQYLLFQSKRIKSYSKLNRYFSEWTSISVVLPSKNKHLYCRLHLCEVIYTETSLIRFLSDSILKKSHFSQLIAYNEKDLQLLANLTLVQFYKYLCLHVMLCLSILYEVDKQLHETFP